MYDGCFGLKRRPFAAVPQVDQYFPATAIEGARATLARSIQRGEGTGLVVGPSGTGKSLLCLLLAEQFRRSFQIVMLSNGRLSSRRALFQAILFELGRNYRGMDEGEARLAVVDCLMAGDESARGVVLLVDEAHVLPFRLLEEIRLLTNLSRMGQPLIRAVLAGGPALEERFASPKLDSFSQRLSARCYLEALNRTETENYIRLQIDSAGGLGDQVFPTETCQSVFQATSGVPRLINQVCDHALLLAYVAGKRQVAPSGIEEAWADLQQLPTPWNGESKSDPVQGGVIEFGSLDDQSEQENPDANATEELSLAAFSGDDPIAGNVFSPRLKAAPAALTTSPVLWRGPLENDGSENDTEPARQICRIEQLLAEADDEFQPAGLIGLEVDLSFEEAIHPFQEAFEHEEVVSDRYSAIMATATVPSVADQSPVSDSPIPSEPPPAKPVPPCDAIPAASEQLAASWQPAGSWQEVVNETLRNRPESEPCSETRRNAELIESMVVSTGALSSTTNPTRPREFRQLFARLSRG